jgi:hypothetical protein
MEAVRTSETSVNNHSTRQFNPEDISEHQTRRRENLKSHIMCGCFAKFSHYYLTASLNAVITIWQCFVKSHMYIVLGWKLKETLIFWHDRYFLTLLQWFEIILGLYSCSRRLVHIVGLVGLPTSANACSSILHCLTVFIVHRVIYITWTLTCSHLCFPTYCCLA